MAYSRITDKLKQHNKEANVDKSAYFYLMDSVDIHYAVNGFQSQVATPSDMQMGVGEVWYSNIAEVYKNNFPSALTSLTCGTQEFADYIANNYESPFLVNEMIKYGNKTIGHPSKLRPALAIAVDAGYPNADVAWSRLISRADPPDYTNDPKYALVPRSLSNLRMELNADKIVINSDDSVTLHWSAPDADECIASGQWSGIKSNMDTETVSGIISSGTFYLECSNVTESARRAIYVTVLDDSTTTTPVDDSGTNNTSTSTNTSSALNDSGSGSLEIYSLLFLLILLRYQYVRRVSGSHFK